MFIVGLTGGIGSGKSTVASLFAKHHITIIDADVIARELVKPGMPLYHAIIQRLGTHFCLPDNNLNRRQLRQHIFNHTQDKAWLESLLHPAISQQMLAQSQTSQSHYCLFVIPLLAESQTTYPLQRILVVDSPLEQQIQRTMSRDNCTRAQVQTIIDTQTTREERLALADDVIENNADIAWLTQQVQRLHDFYLALAQTSPSLTSLS